MKNNNIIRIITMLLSPMDIILLWKYNIKLNALFLIFLTLYSLWNNTRCKFINLVTKKGFSKLFNQERFIILYHFPTLKVWQGGSLKGLLQQDYKVHSRAGLTCIKDNRTQFNHSEKQNELSGCVSQAFWPVVRLKTYI